MRRGRPVKRSPPQPHVRATLDYLSHCDAEDVTIRQGRTIQVAWIIGERRVSIALAPSPGDATLQTKIARQAIRRRYAEAGIEVGA